MHIVVRWFYCLEMLLLVFQEVRYILVFWAGMCSLLHVMNIEGRLISSQWASGLSSANNLILFMHGFLTKIISTLSQAICPSIPECCEMNVISCLVTEPAAEFGGADSFSQQGSHNHKNNHCACCNTKQMQHLMMGKQWNYARSGVFRKASALFRNNFPARSLFFFPLASSPRLIEGNNEKISRMERLTSKKSLGKQGSEMLQLNSYSISSVFSLRVLLGFS